MTKCKNAHRESQESTVPKSFTSFEYEGAVRARRAIKILDKSLSNDTLRARYTYFGQIVDQYEAQMTGDSLAD